MANGLEGILGRKVGMTQIFREDGGIVPVTVLQAGPCVVVGKRTREKDGYEAIQLGLVEEFSKSRLTKPRRGFFDKNKVAPLRTMREFRYEGEAADIGESVKVDLFTETGFVDVVGLSKGKGFAGVMKRHHFGGGRATHGSMFHRAPGSIGQSAYPSRVFKGTRMPGQMGSSRVTVKNLEIVQVDLEKNLLMVKGAVPGARGSLLMIRKARAAKSG
jgi:large subunit ribosomal protein L3